MADHFLPVKYGSNTKNPTVIAEHQAFAWNPSIRGAKSEDTIVLGPSGPVVVTETPGWPMLAMTIDGQPILRPHILER